MPQPPAARHRSTAPYRVGQLPRGQRTGRNKNHPSINLLRQKTPYRIQDLLDKSGGGGDGAGGTLDADRVARNNDVLISLIEKWPLPAGEAKGLAAWVNLCTGALIPLVHLDPAVDITADCRFEVRFRLTSWATGEGAADPNIARTMIQQANGLIGGHMKWAQGPANNLTFQSVAIYKIFRGASKLSTEDKRKINPPEELGIVGEKIVDVGLKKAKEKENYRELISDFQATTTIYVETVFDVLTRGKNFAGAFLVGAKLGGIDLLFTANKLLIQGNGQIKAPAVVGEISNMVTAWFLSSGSAAFVVQVGGRLLAGAALSVSMSTLTVIAVIVGVGVGLWYLWGGGDAWISKHAAQLWDRIEDGTYLEYLENEVNLEEMKRLIADWSAGVKSSMRDFFAPAIEKAYIAHREEYALTELSLAAQTPATLYDYANKNLGGPVFHHR